VDVGQFSFLGFKERPQEVPLKPKKTLPSSHFFGKAAGLGTKFKIS
jgi:hypothetical protein